MDNLGALFIRGLIHGAFKCGASGCECPGCDVILEKLLVDNVDHRGNQGLDVLAAGKKRLDVTWTCVK